jgi:Fe-S-cluster containining protein
MPQNEMYFHELQATLAGILKILEDENPYGAFAAMITFIHDAAESELARQLTPESLEQIACKAGCASCCVINVSTLLPEGIAIATYIRNKFAPAEIISFRQRLKDFTDRIAWVEDEERIRHDIRCIFLDASDACIIHPVRPLLCRGITSTDPLACRRALDSLAEEDEAEGVIMNLVQKFLMESVFKELAQALEKAGLDARPHELGACVLKALAD